MPGLLEESARDFRFARRLLLKSPGFTAVAVLTLALGIGGNTTMFSAVHAILLKPLNYRDPDQLLRIAVDFPGRPGASSFTPLRLEEMRTAPSIAELGSFLIAPLNVTLSGNAEPEALKGASVSANFLHILGVEPALGRSFLLEEDKPGGPPVVLIGWDLWQGRFGGDPLVAGKAVTLDSTPYTVIGVLPAGFQFPVAGLDLWFPKPFAVSGAPPQLWPTIPAQLGFARLKRGASLEQARAELTVLSRQYVIAHPGLGDADPSSTVRVLRMQDQLVTDVRSTLWLLFGAVGFVLLIACANVTSLLLARGATRSREFAVRMAVGATRGRMIRQSLAESILLAFAGGALGVLLANWGLSSITRVNTLNLPRSSEIQLDYIVLGFTTAVSIATSLLFGLFPSLRVSRPDIASLLRLQGAGASETGGRRGTLLLNARGLLVIAQVALSIVLLVGASLLMETLVRLHRVDPGFQSANLLTMRVSLPRTRYDGRKQRAFWEELVRRVDALPGVRGATVAQTLPMTIHYATYLAIAELPPVKVGERPLGQYVSIMPGYFRTIGIPLRRGREFSDKDSPGGGPMVAIIDESLARRFWPGYPDGQDPVGSHLLLGGAQEGGIEIVGIVASVRENGLAADAQPEIYFPLAHRPVPDADLAVRTRSDPLGLVTAVRSQVLAIDRNQPVSAVRTMEDIVNTSIGQRRLTMLLLGVFAGVALMLALVGIYGVIAYTVVQRTQELGIRRALGAQEGDILRLLIRLGLGLTLAGVALGIGGALALTRLMNSMLFHTSATDPATFGSIALLFVLVALTASYIPARRATRIDPMAALRFG
jgi:putative ABC transport system permease protein